MKTKNILYDPEQVMNILLGKKETSVFLEILDNERPLRKVNIDEKDSDNTPLSESLIEIEY